jgi:hypothetical protein
LCVFLIQGFSTPENSSKSKTNTMTGKTLSKLVKLVKIQSLREIGLIIDEDFYLFLNFEILEGNIHFFVK